MPYTCGMDTKQTAPKARSSFASFCLFMAGGVFLVVFAVALTRAEATQQDRPTDDRVRAQILEALEQRRGGFNQLPEQERSRLAAVLIEEEDEDPAPADPTPRLAGTGDVVALWVKSTERDFMRSTAANTDLGLRAHPILFVGIIQAVTETHVTLAGRRWFNSKPLGEDEFFILEHIPRDIVFRVQVLGSTGGTFQQDVIPNTAPTQGFVGRVGG